MPRAYAHSSRMVRSNGSDSHRSSGAGGCTSKWPYTRTVGALSGSSDARISPSASSFSPWGVSSAVPPHLERMKSHTHSPACFTSSRCAESALTLGIAMNSASSLRQVSSTRRDPTQVVRSSAEVSRLVVGIEEAARLQGQAPAPDARREPAANRLERRYALVQLRAPRTGQALPVALRRRPVGGQGVQRLADPLQRDPRRLARLDECDATQRDGGKTPLVVVGAPRRDEPLPLVEAQRGLRDAAALRELADAQLTSHLT